MIGSVIRDYRYGNTEISASNREFERAIDGDLS